MRFGWLAAAAAMVCAVPASADTITQTINFTNRDGSNRYNLFDTRLGYLEEVIGTLTTVTSAEFTGIPPSNYIGGPVTNYINGTLSIFQIPNTTRSFTSVSPGTATVVQYLSYSAATGFDFVASEDLARFNGPGTALVTPNLNITSSYYTYPGGSTGIGQSLSGRGPLISAQFNLTYVYYLPEPASWAMMIFGMAAVGGTLRRRRVSVAYA